MYRFQVTFIQQFRPVGLWCQNDVVSTSMRRHHVASTLTRRHYYVMCPLGGCYGYIFFAYIVYIRTPDMIEKLSSCFYSVIRRWFTLSK